MPIYEYECPKCSHTFEYVTLRVSEPGPERCPECENKELLKVMSTGQKVIYNCTGFYATDHPTITSAKDHKTMHFDMKGGQNG